MHAHVIERGAPHVLANGIELLVVAAHLELRVHFEPAANTTPRQFRVAEAQREALDIHVLEEGIAPEIVCLALAHAHDTVVRRGFEALEALLFDELDAHQRAIVKLRIRRSAAKEGDLVCGVQDGNVALSVPQHVRARFAVVRGRMLRRKEMVFLAGFALTERGGRHEIIRARVWHDGNVLRGSADPNERRVHVAVMVRKWHTKLVRRQNQQRDIQHHSRFRLEVPLVWRHGKTPLFRA